MQARWHGDTIGKAPNKSSLPTGPNTVAVIIPAFNLAHFLADAIKSVLAQTHPADEIIVVDDGSTDDPANVVAQFRNVRLIQQKNRGVAAARNNGLRSCTASYVVFLDADDRLLPTALESGLACFAGNPDCGFVYGGFRNISENGTSMGSEYYGPIEGNAYLTFLRRHQLGPPATALFRRDCLLAVNGFDETIRWVEDYDLTLRIAQRYSVASYPQIVAEYRKHDKNLTNDHSKYLWACLGLLDTHEAGIKSDDLIRAALKHGRADIRRYWVPRMLKAAFTRWNDDHDIKVLFNDLIQAARGSLSITTCTLIRALVRRTIKVLPRHVALLVQRIRGRR